MENPIKKCPKCPYESQCDIILRHHIKGLHKSRETLRVYDAQSTSASCLCEDCLIEAELKSNLLKHLGAEAPPTHTPQPFFDSITEADYEEETMEVSVSPELTETIFLEVYDDEERVEEGEEEEEEEVDTLEEEKVEEAESGVYVCAKCDFKTTAKSALVMHVKHKHDVHLLPEDVEWFECGYCSFKSLDSDCTVDHVHSVHANQ